MSKGDSKAFVDRVKLHDISINYRDYCEGEELSTLAGSTLIELTVNSKKQAWVEVSFGYTLDRDLLVCLSINFRLSISRN